MDITAQDPQSGTQLKIDADRQFTQPTGDSTLRIRSQDGQMDATYVEVSHQEARVVGRLVRILRNSDQQVQDEIAQQVQATFSSKLSGRDAAQLAEIATRAIGKQVASFLGVEEGQRLEAVNALAERFERAASRQRSKSAGWQQQGQPWSGQQGGTDQPKDKDQQQQAQQQYAGSQS